MNSRRVKIFGEKKKECLEQQPPLAQQQPKKKIQHEK